MSPEKSIFRFLTSHGFGLHGDELIVYGHRNDFVVDAAGTRQPKFTDSRAVCIDTISQGILTAMRFPDRLVIQSRST